MAAHASEETEEQEKERVLKATYYDFANPASFGGIKKLSKTTKVPYEKTKQFLSSQDPYSLHKGVRYKFLRRATLSYGINELWQCDLVDLKHLGKHNNGFRYLLTVIDVFRNMPEGIVSITILPKVIIRLASLKGLTECLECSHIEIRIIRISKANKTFRRGYLPGWSDEVFRVTKVYFSHPTTFELQDLKSEAIKGRFYAEELQKISKRSDDYWRIEKVLKTKGKGRKKEYYVKWQGFDERFNSWVKEAWMR
ncbi:uncharacterized transposon-derived protein F54H12.3 [Trichonephila clavata]|uniref:Uncharacterized transposon-derived protein F54H12.3 n=1 Tax=Trichonephila clavata TaxID=2740835 RepID=A0A8X6M522_TRICU|nr:uncharacterized transposon-derived protein F54H12.3 [Trichonephila clavata]